MKNLKFLNFLLPVFALSLFVVACGGNTENTQGDSATEQTEETGHMENGDHMDHMGAEADAGKQGKEYTAAYICPMHCEGSGSDAPGECPVCGMDYVKNEDMPAGDHDHDHDGDHDHDHDDHEGHNH
ncbi:MAG: heavy metal-binding domain-containing protein [Phaeodactylibacter sp.]|uniref:heavy metal-binding domain-containing protein n=1 Tax=Phaeodactylibacter sp. TaxID=1940289 RepID=UPI0032EE3C1F